MTGELDAKWRAHIEINRKAHRELRDYLLDLAVHREVNRARKQGVA